MPYRVIVPPDIEKRIAEFHPLLKSKIRAGLDDLSRDPYQGKALRQELKGFYSFQVSRYRIVYGIHHLVREVNVLAIGPRHNVYRSLSEVR